MSDLSALFLSPAPTEQQKEIQKSWRKGFLFLMGGFKGKSRGFCKIWWADKCFFYKDRDICNMFVPMNEAAFINTDVNHQPICELWFTLTVNRLGFVFRPKQTTPRPH